MGPMGCWGILSKEGTYELRQNDLKKPVGGGEGDLEGLREVSVSRREVSLAVGSHCPGLCSMCACSLALESPSTTLIHGGRGHDSLCPGIGFRVLLLAASFGSLFGRILLKLLECLCPSQQSLCHRTRLRSTSPRTVKLAAVNEKTGLKFNIQKTKIMASCPITLWKIVEDTMETVTDFIFLGSKITIDDDFSYEIKRCLLLERKAMTNLDSVLESRDITLMTNVHVVKAMVFPVVIYECEKRIIKKAER